MLSNSRSLPRLERATSSAYSLATTFEVSFSGTCFGKATSRGERGGYRGVERLSPRLGQRVPFLRLRPIMRSPRQHRLSTLLDERRRALPAAPALMKFAWSLRI